MGDKYVKFVNCDNDKLAFLVWWFRGQKKIKRISFAHSIIHEITDLVECATVAFFLSLNTFSLDHRIYWMLAALFCCSIIPF